MVFQSQELHAENQGHFVVACIALAGSIFLAIGITASRALKVTSKNLLLNLENDELSFQDIDIFVISFWTCLSGVGTCLAIGAAAGDLSWPSPTDWGFMIVIGVLSFFGQNFQLLALKVSVLVTCRSNQILHAGTLIFHCPNCN